MLRGHMQLRTVADTFALGTLVGACALRVLLALGSTPGSTWHVAGVFGTAGVSADVHVYLVDACRVLMALSVVLQAYTHHRHRHISAMATYVLQACIYIHHGYARLPWRAACRWRQRWWCRRAQAATAALRARRCYLVITPTRRSSCYSGSSCT